jgi:molybdopterin-containing oxidoreductase family iron-sulfur binding subunit
MKRKVEHPAPSERELSGPRYWRSLDELADTPGFKAQLEREFPEGASSLQGVDRRHFFKIMAASFALGGAGLATGCRRPESHILPFGKSVEGIIPGLPSYFATSLPHRGGALPLIAETHSGRPTKLEGNPSYTPTGGASSLLAQASILDLYDPDRATVHTTGGRASTPAAMRDKLAAIATDYRATRGAGLAILAEPSTSPTRARLFAELRRALPQALVAEYEPVTAEPPLAAAQAVFGRAVKPLYRFAKAKRVVAIDADFFHQDGNALVYARDFASARRVRSRDDAMNRLYSVESTFTLTGSMADHRLRLASSHMLAFAAALASKVLGSSDADRLAQGLDFKNKDAWLDACAADLIAHRGESLVVAGVHQPAAVHALAYAINAALGNIGSTIDFVAVEPPASVGLTELAAAAREGKVNTLVILGGNPAYNAPADINFAELVKQSGEVIRYGYYSDETTLLATSHVVATHYLESWGDARTADGTVVPVQPMILPLFDGLTEVEVVARLAGVAESDPYTLVYETVTGLAAGDGAAAFRTFLHDGLLADSAYPIIAVTYNAAGAARLLNGAAAPVALSKDNLEVRFATDHKVDDGRYANNGWLQECPDPITKIAWDNAILVSPKLGRELGIEPGGSMIQVARKEAAEFSQGKERAFIGEVMVNGVTVRGPLTIQPGLSDWTIVLPLGYGRSATGRVGQGVGFNAYPAVTSATPAFATGAKLTVTSDRYFLANVQEHWSMEGRAIVREANYEGKYGYAEKPDWTDHMGVESHAPANLGKDRDMPLGEVASTTPRGNSLYETPDFNGTHQWGMSIDLNTCIGCNACVVACQAENNIPIVGKDQVLRGREMHWIRLDRYYSDGKIDGGAFGGEGNKIIPEDPQASLQPVACVHCELAPCEVVCPVNATVHDEEGLNVMAYNRCIGTRYCANNCPYKVRRFNFFDHNKRRMDELYLGPLGQSGMPELVKMAKNPDVTVRMRGVMEKCTYCVQRIQQAKIAQKVKARDSADIVVPDGTIKTACQQVCPVDSIVFGDIKDPNSAVSQAKAQDMDYALLGYLNVRPRTTYLGKLRNPNPAMPDYDALPLSRIEYKSKNYPAAPAAGKPDHASIEQHALRTGGIA